jgi:hypothetical protein
MLVDNLLYNNSKLPNVVRLFGSLAGGLELGARRQHYC